MSFIKLNLSYGDHVFIKGVNPEIDGQEVKMIGVAVRGIIDNYIVEFLDGKTMMSYENFGQVPVEYKALVLPEVCLTLGKDSNGIEINNFDPNRVYVNCFSR